MSKTEDNQILIKSLKTKFSLKTNVSLSVVLGTHPSNIKEINYGRGGKTYINACILINELADRLSTGQLKKAVLSASEQQAGCNRYIPKS